jgi:hypothetical protein
MVYVKKELENYQKNREIIKRMCIMKEMKGRKDVREERYER